MAVVGAAITAAWTWLGASGAGALVGRLLLSTAVSAISTAIQKQLNKPQQPGIKTEYTTDGGDKPMTFVLGWYATDGHMVCPPMSHGKFDDWSNAYLTYVIDLGNVPGAQIDKVIIDDTEVAFEAADQSIPQGGAVPLGRPREWYTQQGIDPDNPNAPAPERPVITPGRPITTEKYKTKVWLRYYDGNQTAADPYLLQVYGPGTKWAEKSERPWTADMVGVGTCYAILTFRYSTKSFNGLPRCRFVMRGTPLYDPRKDSSVGGSGTQRWDSPATWATTTNGMVIAYNILRGIPVPGGPIWGYGVPASGMPRAEWTAAMNAADQIVDGRARWQAAWEVSTSEEPAAVLDEVLKVCCAKVAESAGIWRVRVGPPAAPVLFFSDDDLILEEDATATPFPGLEATFNGVHATYPEPAQLWRPKDAPPRYNAAWEAADQGRRLVAELNMPACPWDDQVQRVMRAYIEEERHFRRHVIALPLEAEALEPLDVIAWSSAEQGYDAKLFEVQEVGEATDTMRVTVSVVEVDPADYDWRPDFKLPNPIVKVTRPTPGPVVPTYFTAEGIALTAADGRPRRAAARLRWGGWALDGITAVRWELRRTGQTEAARGLMGDPEAGETLVTAGLLPATSYEARISFLADGEREVAWTTWVPFTTPDVRLRKEDLDPEVLAGVDRLTEWMDGTGGYLRELDDVIDALRDGVTETEWGNFTAHEIVRQEAAAAVADARAYASSELIAATGPDSALAAKIDQVNASIPGAVAEGTQALVSRVKDTEEGLVAQSDAINAVTARTDRGTAKGLLRVTALSAPDGVRTRIGLRAEASDASAEYSAALLLEAATDGTSAIAAVANRFAIVESPSVGAARSVPFIVKDGKVYIDNLVVENGSFDTIKLAGNAVTVSSFVTGKTNDLQMTYVLSGPLDESYSVFIMATMTMSNTGWLRLYVNGSEKWAEQPSGGTLASRGYGMTLSAGTHTIRLVSDNTANTNGASIWAMTGKR